MKRLMLFEQSPVFAYQALAQGALMTTHPRFVFGAGHPPATIDWGDGSSAPVTSGVELNKTYGAEGTYLVRLLMPRQDRWLQQIDVGGSTEIISGSSWAVNLRRFRALTHWFSHSCTRVGGCAVTQLPMGMTTIETLGGSNALTGNVVNLPRGLNVLVAGLASNNLTGTIADLPRTGTRIWLSGGLHNLTGSLSDMPPNTQVLELNSNASRPTPGTPPATIQQLLIQSTALTQAQVDEIINNIYAARMSFTWATPVLNIAGTNAAASGVFQSMCPPTTPKERAFQLVNDSCASGHNRWTITMN